MNPEQIAEMVSDLIATWGVKVVMVFVALFAAWIVAGAVRRGMLRSFERVSFDATLARFFGNMVRYAILVATGLGCLGAFGIETASFAAVIAAGGLAVGLAFQGTLSNFAAGVMLLAFRPFKVGDFVNLGGTLGTVQEIELFTIELTTLDNRRIIVPNSAVFGSVIENFTAHDTRRVDVPVGTDYGADLEKVRAVLEGVPAKVPGALAEPAPQIFLAALGGSSIDWQLRIWSKTEDYWDVHQAIILQTKKALDAAGVGIPFPQTDVHLDDGVVQALSKL